MQPRGLSSLSPALSTKSPWQELPQTGPRTRGALSPSSQEQSPACSPPIPSYLTLPPAAGNSRDAVASSPCSNHQSLLHPLENMFSSCPSEDIILPASLLRVFFCFVSFFCHFLRAAHSPCGAAFFFFFFNPLIPSLGSVWGAGTVLGWERRKASMRG